MRITTLVEVKQIESILDSLSMSTDIDVAVKEHGCMACAMLRNRRRGSPYISLREVDYEVGTWWDLNLPSGLVGHPDRPAMAMVGNYTLIVGVPEHCWAPCPHSEIERITVSVPTGPVLRTYQTVEGHALLPLGELGPMVPVTYWRARRVGWDDDGRPVFTPIEHLPTAVTQHLR